MSTAFDTKPAKFLNDVGKLKFTGAIISQTMRSLHLSQPEKIKKPQQLGVNNATVADYVVERTSGAYIVAICRSDAFYSFNIVSEITNSDMKGFNGLNKTIEKLLNTTDKLLPSQS